MEIPLEYYTERDIEPPGLSYSVAEHGDWDYDDWEAARLATEIDAAGRLAAQVQRLEWEIIRLQDILADNGIDYGIDDDPNINDEPPYGSFPEER